MIWDDILQAYIAHNLEDCTVRSTQLHEGWNSLPNGEKWNVEAIDNETTHTIYYLVTNETNAYNQLADTPTSLY